MLYLPDELSDLEIPATGRGVLVGMTEKEVSSAWGSPDRTHPVHGVDVSSDRWTFRREGEGLVDIYFKNGVVTNISR